MARTPKLALWLLRTCDSGDSIDALIGDLAEECERGRGQWWFCWQAIAAVTIGVLATVWTHKRLAIESVAVGWAVLAILSLASSKLITGPLVLQLFAGRGLSGWEIGLLHLPEWAITMFGSSWVVARLHPRMSFAMACAFIASFLALHAGTVGWLLASSLLTNQAIAPNDWTNLLNLPFTFALMIAGAVAGARRPLRLL